MTLKRTVWFVVSVFFFRHDLFMGEQGKVDDYLNFFQAPHIAHEH